MWEIAYKNVRKSLEAWGIHKATRCTRNQGMDRVQLWQSSTLPQAVFEANENLEIYKDNVCWFRGKITQTPCLLSIQNEEQIYEISGIWWYLSHLVYQQTWQYAPNLKAESKPFARGICLLGQTDKGDSATAATCLREILQYAIQRGAPFQIGKLEGFDFFFPCESVKDCSCAECLQRILRWTPDAVCWTDYASDLPTFHIARKAFLVPQIIDLQEAQNLQIVPRNDLQVSAVVLKYEHTHTEGKQVWKTNTVDAYPQTATGNEFNALVLTFELEGSQTHVQKQAVKTEKIETNSVAWWQQHCPCLRALDPAQIQLSDIQRETALAYELLEGAIAPWMPCQARYETISAKVHYTCPSGEICEQLLTVQLCATDAISDIYETCSYIKGGIVPKAGLAKELFDASAILQFEGQLTLVQAEVGPVYVGNTLSFEGGNSAWKDMKAVIQEAFINIKTGVTRLKFGAPKHLGPNDLIQLMRPNRSRNTSNNPEMRQNAFLGASPTITYFPTHMPRSQSSSDTGQLSKMVVSTKDAKKIILDANSLPNQAEMKLRAYNIVDSGVLKQVWMLTT